MERDIPSRDMYSVYHLDDNEFFPGDYVAKADGKFISSISTDHICHIIYSMVCVYLTSRTA